MKRHAIVIEKATANHVAYVPDLPGCIATGATAEEFQRGNSDCSHAARGDA